ncbi:MAG: type III secretion system chaperone, partial [Desulfobacteraceae bacterium]|nr:type III secretion system chaperone [Desulfobacteraceae bacterium]
MIQRWIESVCSHAGWEVPGKNIEGKYRFRLEPDIIVDASSPDERILVLEAQVTTFSRFDRDSILKKAATAVLPRVFKDTFTLSLDNAKKRLCLHSVVTLGALRASEFPEVMESFINGLVFYKS